MFCSPELMTTVLQRALQNDLFVEYEDQEKEGVLQMK